MNSKKPKRYNQAYIASVLRARVGPDGHYVQGLNNETIAQRLGELAAFWPQVEEQMVEFLRLLLNQPLSFPSRQIFRSMVSQQARIQVMRTLLERTKLNQDRGEEYDAILDEFIALNKKRERLPSRALVHTRERARIFGRVLH